MTLAELLDYLDANTAFTVLDGDAGETLSKARDGSHKEPIMGEIITTIATASGAEGAAAELTRAETVNALGPLRLKYMADDAPVEGFRMIEGIIHGIDGAFNAEALDNR